MNWHVLKFGGTSVSSKNNWKVICDQVHTLIQSSSKTMNGHDTTTCVWIVTSALSQVTNHLSKAIEEAISCTNHFSSYEWIVQQHFYLCYTCDLIDESTMQDLISTANDYRFSVFELRKDPEYNVMKDDLRKENLGDVLDLLQDLCRLLEGIKLTGEASPRIRARVLSFGELLSTQVGIRILQHHGIEGILVDARKLIISKQDNTLSEEQRYLQADPSPVKDVSGALKHTKGKHVVLTQGFIAGTDRGETCVLGRGGSDTSGALFASMLEATKLEIWTDVHGIFTSDPRFLPTARLIKELSYREAQELAAMGAKVLHPRCIGPAQFANVPIEIRNTFDPCGQRTQIQATKDSVSAKVLAVVRRNEMTLLTINAFNMCGASGFLSRVFSPFEQLGISVDLIATSQFSVSVTLDFIPGGVKGSSFEVLLKHLKKLGEIQVLHPCSVVSIVGRKLRTSLHEIGLVLEVLKGYEVHLVSESAEDLNLSFVVDQNCADQIVSLMHHRFFPLDDDDDDVKKETFLSPIQMERMVLRDELLGDSWQQLKLKALDI